MKMQANDPNFSKLFEKTSQSGWLGDAKLVGSLLRVFAHNALDGDDAAGGSFSARIDKEARDLAKIFLGQDSNYPAPAWFGPGQVDKWLADKCGIQSNDPVECVAGALLAMIGELLELASSLENENSLPEQWQWQANAILDSYTHLFLGIPT